MANRRPAARRRVVPLGVVGRVRLLRISEASGSSSTTRPRRRRPPGRRPSSPRDPRRGTRHMRRPSPGVPSPPGPDRSRSPASLPFGFVRRSVAAARCRDLLLPSSRPDRGASGRAPPSGVLARVLDVRPEPAVRSFTVEVVKTSPVPAIAATPAPMCTARPSIWPSNSTSPVWPPARISRPSGRTASAMLRRIGRRAQGRRSGQQAIAGGVHIDAVEPLELARACRWYRRGAPSNGHHRPKPRARTAHDVGEQDGGRRRVQPTGARSAPTKSRSASFIGPKCSTSIVPPGR